VPDLLAGAWKGGVAFIDIDDTIREVHGHAKQGAAFGLHRRARQTVCRGIGTPRPAASRTRARSVRTPTTGILRVVMAKCPHRTQLTFEHEDGSLAPLLACLCNDRSEVVGEYGILARINDPAELERWLANA
jgi:hypothetical protein